MTTYYRNEYLFSEIYLQEITQQPEDTEILASLTTLKEYREWARTATIQEWKDSFVHEVLYALGFGIKSENERLTLLYPVGHKETPLTLCYVLLPTEDLNNTTMGQNWAEKVIRSLRHHNLKWGLLTNGERWRIYHFDESTPYEIFLEMNLAAILSDSASQDYQIFHKFMKVENFTKDEQGQCRLDMFKKESLAKIDYIESELANALKQKEEGGKGVLSNLCMGYVEFLKASGDPNLDDDAMRIKIYHGAMLYMFRLLFLFYADARSLLNETNSSLLKDVLQRSKAASPNDTSTSNYSIWEDLESIFVDIDQSYNGGLFDPHESEFTQFIEEERVNDAYLAAAVHYLTSYQERSREEKAISYRDMSVRHLGTLYEGLLEHKLFIAKEDTEVRAAKDIIQFIPASQGGRIVAGRYITAGQVYFGSDRSEKKATGSFYTPEYIVDYIVRNTVGEKLFQLRQDFLAEQKDLLSAVGKALDQKERKALTELLEDNLKAFIREKVLKLSALDPAMGSGHFLVNASNYIANFITEILNELEIIGTAETSTTYWRRWVVENCVYGVDVNPLAVELAKLSLWILSMSKEKPLSFLNHNLKTGNSLISARLDDIGRYPGKGDKKQLSIFSADQDFKAAVGKAISNYIRITSTDSASLDVIADKKAWLDEIDDILKPYKLICDLHTSIYFGNEISEWQYKELICKKDIDHSYNVTLSCFHWELGFPEVMMKEGGFDVVFANPPYIKEYINRNAFDGLRHSPYYQGKMDIWYLFACSGIDLLRKEKGILAFIAQNNWVTSYGASILRNKIIKDTQIMKLVDFGNYKIFENAGIQTMIMIFKADIISDSYTFDYRRFVNNQISYDDVLDLLAINQNPRNEYLNPIVQRKQFIDKSLTFSGADVENILNQILTQANFKLSDKEAANGIHHHHDSVNKERQAILNDKFKVGEGIFVLNDEEKNKIPFTEEELKLIRPSYTTKELFKYYGNPNNREWVIYTDSKFKDPDNISPYSNIQNHLDKFIDVITSANRPYGLHRARDERFFLGEKIISVRKCARPTFTYTNFNCYVSATFYVIKTDRINLKYLTALLNSKLIAFWLRHKGKMQGNNYQIDKQPILQIPIKEVSFMEQRPLIDIIDHILLIAKKDSYIPSFSSKEKIKECEHQIDLLVYNLYGISDADVSIIEKDIL